MPTTVAFLPPVFVPLVTAASSSVSLSLCCRPSASLRSPSGSPFEPSKPRLPIIVACTAAPFNEFEAKVRAQKQLCKVAEFSESTCLGVEETIHCDGALNVGKDECAEVVENTWIQFQPLVSVPWDSLACLLFWCMLLDHHLRGLEYLLELMQLFRESVKVETISQEGDNDARELQIDSLIFSVGRRRLFDEPSMTPFGRDEGLIALKLVTNSAAEINTEREWPYGNSQIKKPWLVIGHQSCNFLLSINE